MRPPCAIESLSLIHISGALPKASVIYGDGTDSDLLQDEGIASVDACVSLTGNDEENILISLFAGTKEVDKTITKIKRISFYGLLSKISYEGSVVSPVFATAYDILRFVRATENAQDSSLNTLYKICLLYTSWVLLPQGLWKSILLSARS